MSSLEITLQEFVRKLPLCPTNVSWDLVVTAIDSSLNGIIAIIDDDGCPLGILEGYRLLSKLARSKIGSDDLRQNQPGESSFFPIIFSEKINLSNLITQVTSLSSQMKLDNLISFFGNQDSNISDKNYIVVNPNGKVLGLLDIPKVLKYLAKDNTSIENNFPPQIPCDRHSLLELLEQIPLPLMLQTVTGTICYQNSYWRSHINNQEKIESVNNFDSLSTEWLVLQQSLAKKRTVKRNSDSAYCYCPQGDERFNTLRFDSLPPPSMGIYTTKNLEDTSDNFLDQVEFENGINSVAKKEEPPWEYLKFSINLSEESWQKKSPEKICWLVLGTQVNQSKPKNFKNFTSTQVQIDRPKLKRLQSEFIISTSHDLKSPLTAIIGLSSLLKEEKLGVLNQRQIRYADLIYRGGRQLMGIVNDLLDVTSLAEGQLRLNWETIELENLCYQAYEQVRKKLEALEDPKKKSTSLFPHFQLDVDKKASVVTADRLRLNQIIVRLLENALQLTPVEGEIGITTALWGDWIAITVWDTGRGIAESYQEYLLEGLLESNNFLASSERGMGLGLILAQQLAQAHGGDLSFTSQIGKGSEFTVLLPLNHTQNLGQDCPLISSHNYQLTSDKTDQKSSLVLIAETSPRQISHLTTNLHQLGYHTAIARSGNEALYKARHLQPIKIILNRDLSLLSGQNVLENLKSEESTRKIPVLLILDDKFSSSKWGQAQSGEEVKRLSQNYYPQVEQVLRSPISPEILTQYFTPLKPTESLPARNLTMLHLCLNSPQDTRCAENSRIDLLLSNPSFNLCHHIIEADSVEQANTLARIWRVDAIIWDGSNLESPSIHLKSLAESPKLAKIPIITLDKKTTGAANQFKSLSVFPCLIPINEQNITELMAVIQRAVQIRN